MSVDLTPFYKNMLNSMTNFLNDDCYVYIMTIGVEGYYKHIRDMKNNFYTFEMTLCSQFRTRLMKIYEKLENTKSPNELIDNMYKKIIIDTINRINNEDNTYRLSFNEKASGYTIVIMNNYIR